MPVGLYTRKYSVSFYCVMLRLFMFCLHVNKVKGGEKAETSDFAHIEGIT